MALVVAATEPSRFSADTADSVADPRNQILVSGASAWEIATKYRLGKLPQAEQLVVGWSESLSQLGFSELDVTAAHGIRGGSYDVDHRDPFDRLIAAQGELQRMPIISNDTKLDLFPITRIW